jgi:hypothetical protein
MNRDEFWKIIENSRRGASCCEEIAENLTSILELKSGGEIISFANELRMVLNESFRWDLWAVAYIVNGGCSDDGFEYFRGWLICQGRKYFEAALENPENASKRIKDEEVECEDILYVPHSVYEAKMNKEMPELKIKYLKKPKGKKWKSEEELETLYPKLCKRFYS